MPAIIRDPCKSCRLSKDNLFLLLSLAGILFGFALGLAARTARPSDDVLLWIGMPGELFVRMLKATIMPLVACSVINGIASNDPKSSGKIGLVSLLYIVITNALGVVLGVLACLIANPANEVTADRNKVLDTRNLGTVDIIADFIRNMFPENIVGATLQQSQTKYRSVEVTRLANISGEIVNVTSTEMTRSLATIGGTNILGLVMICAVLGIAAAKLGTKGQHFVSFIQSTYVIIMKVFIWIKWSSPIGVCSLIAHILAGTENLHSALQSIGLFVAIVCSACLIHILIILPMIYFVFTRRNPLAFLISITRPLIMGFGPANSMAALPDMVRVSTNHYKIDKRVATFVLPLCVVLNRDGSALFISASCISIARFSGIQPDAGLYLIIILLTFVSSLAIPAVNSSSVMATLVILESLSIPPANIGLILAMDWLSDRVRTATNIASHMTGLSITWQLCKKSFQAQVDGCITEDIDLAESDKPSPDHQNENTAFVA